MDGQRMRGRLSSFQAWSSDSNQTCKTLFNLLVIMNDAAASALGRAQCRMLAKALFGFWVFLPVESTLFRNVQREVIHRSGCPGGFPKQHQGGGWRGTGAGPCRRWERAASEGQLDAASGYKREGMRPPESSCYVALATKETTVGREDEAQSGTGGAVRWRRHGGAFWLGCNEEIQLGFTSMYWIKAVSSLTTFYAVVAPLVDGCGITMLSRSTFQYFYCFKCVFGNTQY